MQRRSLLAGLGAATLAAPTMAATSSRTGLTFDSYLKAINDAQRVACGGLRAGDPVRLVLQPQRRFDPRSIAAVASSGAVLGYLPGHSTRHLAALLEQGWRASGIVQREFSGTEVPIRLELSPT